MRKETDDAEKHGDNASLMSRETHRSSSSGSRPHRIAQEHGLEHYLETHVQPSFLKSFEPPPWHDMILHTVCCFLAFPLVYVLAPVTAFSLSVFWTRTVVSIISGAVGVMLSVALTEMGKRYLAAAGKSNLLNLRANRI
jgi:hypothetical protein